MRRVFTAGLFVALLLSACGTTPAGSGGAPAAPAQTAVPVVPAATAVPKTAGTAAPAPSAMPSNDPYGYGY